MTDQRRTHSAKNLQEFIEQMSRRRNGPTPPALTDDPWGDDKSAAATGEVPPRPETRPSGSTVGEDAGGDPGNRGVSRGSDNRVGRSPSAPTAAHARAAATLGRGAAGAPPQARPPTDPPQPTSAEPTAPEAASPPPASASSPRIKTKPPSTDRVGRPRLRDSGRRIEPEANAHPSEQRIVTERPEEREPLRWPVIVLSALVAGGVIILTAVKAKQYVDRPESAPPTAVAASTPPPAAPEADSPTMAPAPEQLAAAPAPEVTPGPEPAATTPAPAVASASESPVPAGAAAAAPGSTPPAAAPASEPASVAPELPDKRVAHVEAPNVADKTPNVADKAPNVADKTPNVADKAPNVADKTPKPRPRPARPVKAAVARPRPEPEAPSSRAERTDDKPVSDAGKPEVAKAEAAAPDAPRTRASEPRPSESQPVARPEPPRTGTIDVAATRAAARAQIGPVRQCYERARMDDASLAGTVTARITVGPDGSVAKVEIASSTLGAPPVETCILQAISRWRLPKPNGGAAASLTYPLVFQ
jgi:TonB family protein